MPPEDRVLAGLVANGHSREAICLYLDTAEKDVLSRCAALDLPAPVSRLFRKSCSQNAWQIEDVRKLIDAWIRNYHVTNIAMALGRSPYSIYGKARRLGLPRRKRTELIKELPLFASAQNQEAKPEPPRCPKRPDTKWDDNLIMVVSDRWFAGQHYKAIARDLNISAAAVRSKATRIGLPPRDRREIVSHYDPARGENSPLRANLVLRQCSVTGMLFWGTRNGPRTSPAGQKSRRYAEMQAGFTEYTFAG